MKKPVESVGRAPERSALLHARRAAPGSFFVTATDTGVGKTQVACALLELLAARGLRPGAFKPYESGCDDLRRPADAVCLREAAGAVDPLSRVCLHRFRAPLAPGVAAAREGRRPSFLRALRAFESFASRPVIAEGAGGLRVPLDAKHDVIDLIARLGLDVVLVGRAGLGTLNHVGLSLEALTQHGLTVRAVVLTQSSPASDPSMRDNARWLRARHRVEVIGPVPFCERLDDRRLAYRRALAPLVQKALRVG